MVSLALAATVLGWQSQPDPSSELPDLVRQYKEYGIPLPPREYVFCAGHEGSEAVYFARRADPRLSYIAIERMVHASSCFVSTRILRGVSVGYEPKPETWASISDLRLRASTDYTLLEDANLALAIIEEDRGKHDFAKAILNHQDPFPADDTVTWEPVDWAPAGSSLPTRLAYLAEQHWVGEIVQPASNYASIERHLQFVFRRNPALLTEKMRLIMASLHLTVTRRHEGTDREERLIDDLCDFAHPDLGWAMSADYWDPPRLAFGGGISSPSNWRTERYRYAYRIVDRIFDEGFDAIPALIAHVDDRRLTHGHFYDLATPLISVGGICRMILQDYAHGLDDEWPPRDAIFSHPAEDWSKWWTDAKRRGEEPYLVDRLVHTWEGLYPAALVLRVLAKRQPGGLLTLYRLLVDRPNVQSWPVAEAICRSSFLKSVKIDAYRPMLSQRGWLAAPNAVAALTQILQLDRRAFDDAAILWLGREATELNPNLKRDYVWVHVGALISLLNLDRDWPDERILEALHGTAERLEVEQRVHFISQIAGPWGSNYDPRDERARHLLELFFEDPSPEVRREAVHRANQFASAALERRFRTPAPSKQRL